MKKIDSYIIEKLHLNKDIKTLVNVDEVNKEYISNLKKYFLDKWGIKFESWKASISADAGKRYILISLKNYHNSYKNMINDIDKNFELTKPCKTNNQSIYVYPKYD